MDLLMFKVEAIILEHMLIYTLHNESYLELNKRAFSDTTL